MLLFSAPSFGTSPTYNVFTEGYADGWLPRPWDAIETTNTNVSYTFKGSKSIKVVYTAPWGGFRPAAIPMSFDTTGYRDLTFAVYNYSGGDDLRIIAANSAGTFGPHLRVSNYSGSDNLAVGKWTWVRIPIADLGLGSSPILWYVAIRSSKPATVYFDDLHFSVSTPIYEGVGKIPAPGIRTWTGEQIWKWNATVTPYPLSGKDYYVNVVPSKIWGGVGFLARINNLSTADYGALAIRFKQDTSTQRLWIVLVDRNGVPLGAWVRLDQRYLPSALAPIKNNEWYHMTVPLTDFAISSPWVAGLAIESDTASAPFAIDDVRFVQKLSYPLKDVVPQVSGYHFGEEWLNACDSLMKLHAGSDYFDNASEGAGIYAASRGVVKQVGEQAGWGHFVVLQHESRLTTSYLHLRKPSLSVGAEVQRGTLLGTTTNLPSGSHLHFGLRVAEFDSTVSQVGALPQKPCVISGKTYPAFPAYFIDSERAWAIPR